MVKYSQTILFEKINNVPSETIRTVMDSQKYRDFTVFFQFCRGRENDFGVGLKIAIPSLYRRVTITYSIWVRKSKDNELIPLRTRSRNFYDDGRNEGFGGWGVRDRRIDFSRLRNDCLFPIVIEKDPSDGKEKKFIDRSGRSVTDDACVEFMWEIHEIDPRYDESRIIEALFRDSSLLSSMVLDSEKAYSDYKYAKREYERIQNQAELNRTQISSQETRIQELEKKIPDLEAAEERILSTLQLRKKKLDQLVDENKEKVKLLKKQDFLKCLLQMDPEKVEIFQFDAQTLENIGEGILRLQGNLVKKSVSR